MTRENSRTAFTKAELTQIEQLVGQLERAENAKQKGIRDKIRTIGLYWSEVAGRGIPYTVENLYRLVAIGTIRIKNGATNIKLQPAVKKTSATTSAPCNKPTRKGGRINSDEYYVISLCNEVLGMTALQQYKFPFLLGDAGTMLPVDAYYPELNLVVEYYEKQHTEQVKFFDKKNTISGISRGEQRRIYDERRRVELPKHGIKLVIISYSDFGNTKKLCRNHNADVAIVKHILMGYKIKVK